MARQNLQAVLEKKAKGVEPEPVAAPALTPAVETRTTASVPSHRSATRVGKVTVAGYFPKDVRASLRMIQAKHPERNIQDLLAEALNDLFAKYNVPQTAPREQS